MSKYKPLFNIPTDTVEAKQRARHVEYMNDHALVGRAQSAKYTKLVQMEIMKNVRWHSLKSHKCDHPNCEGYVYGVSI